MVDPLQCSETRILSDLCEGTGALAIALPESRDKARTADVGDTMRPGVAQALRYSDSRNELAWLVLRVYRQTCTLHRDIARRLYLPRLHEV